MIYVKPKITGKIDTSKLKKAEEKLKREIKSKLNTARKRIKRLERNNLTHTPAYQRLVKDGNVPKFGVRGKSFNELQQELSRINRFLNSETSTVRKTNKILKDLAQITNIKYKRISEIQAKAKTFFEIASKVEQYLDNTQAMAGAIGYRKIWNKISQYTKENKNILEATDNDIDSVAVKLGELLATENFDEKLQGLNKYIEKFY